MHPYRTHTCAQLSSANVGETVRLSGWIHRKRDHGGVLFVDLRDHYGITQIVADSDSPALPVLEGLRVESVVTIEGDKAAGQQKISIGQRVRDVRQGPDGFVYVLTDEAKGRVVRLVAE